MKILFIRHPKTQDNHNNVWCGLRDCEISQDGLKQLHNLKNEIKKYQVTKIFTSPCRRAYIVAQELSRVFKLEIHVEQNLIERDFGKLEGLPCNSNDKLLMADFNLNSDLNLGIEKIQGMYLKRVKPFIERIWKESEKNDTIVVISHSWVGRLFAFYFSNEKDFDIITKAPINCKIYEYNVNN